MCRQVWLPCISMQRSHWIKSMIKWNSAKSIAILKVNPTSTSKETRSEVIQNSFGHSKVVLPSGLVGTVLPRWDVPAEVLHCSESLLSVIIRYNELCWNAINCLATDLDSFFHNNSTLTYLAKQFNLIKYIHVFLNKVNGKV